MKDNIVLTIIGLIVLIVILWDIWLASDKTEGNTISEIITRLAYKYPLIPFALGMLAGHWFWK